MLWLSQKARKKLHTHTKLRRSLPCTNYWYDMMPVSWQECLCCLGLALNPDSVLDVVKLMDFQNFFISRLNTWVLDQEKTLWGHQQDTAEVLWKFAATEAEIAWGENEVLQVLGSYLTQWPQWLDCGKLTTVSPIVALCRGSQQWKCGRDVNSSVEKLL